MAEHLESLLQKIHDEAVAKADAAAAARLAAAEQRAKEIERAATQRAEALVADAEQRARQHAASGTQALEHAARDVLIYVRQSIMKYFATLIETAVPELVPLERVQDILEQIALEAQKRGRSTEGVKVFVSERDQKALVDFFMHQFRQAVSGGAELHPMKGLRAGFRIRLHDKDVEYDFSDEVIVQMISQLINPALEEVLTKAVKEPASAAS